MGRFTKSRDTPRQGRAALASGDSALTNADISGLLATEAEIASQPLQRAFRRASRKALLWPDEASHLYGERRSLTELPGIGPTWTKLYADGWNTRRVFQILLKYDGTFLPGPKRIRFFRRSPHGRKR